MNILDQIARRPNQTCPNTADEFFAFCLARELGEPFAAEHYVELLAQYSEDTLISAFHRATRKNNGSDLARSFHVELSKSHGNGGNGISHALLAIKVERRSIAAAIFNGDHLDYTQVRQLSSVAPKALASTDGFLNWLLANFDIESAAVETIPAGIEVRRSELSRAIVATLRRSGLPIWEVTKEQVFESYGHPKLSSRPQVRKVIGAIWPVLGSGNGQNQLLDAVALGLWVQTERRFLN